MSSVVISQFCLLLPGAVAYISSGSNRILFTWSINPSHSAGLSVDHIQCGGEQVFHARACAVRKVYRTTNISNSAGDHSTDLFLRSWRKSKGEGGSDIID